MTGICVVLNGASSSGKTSIALALQEMWNGTTPLQVSGFDTFLQCQARGFFGIDGESAPGFEWKHLSIEGDDAQEIVTGHLGYGLIRSAQSFWRSCALAGIDQVVDDVWITREQALGFKSAMEAIDVLWVGVRCSLEVLVAREAARGDRSPGQARWLAGVVHSFSGYDLEVDTTDTPPADNARLILEALDRRRHEMTSTRPLG